MSLLRSDESGFTLIEAMVASFIGSILLAGVATLVVSSSRTGAFTEGQSQTINATRNAVERVSKEIRGADTIVWCSPAGECLQVGAQKVAGGFRTVRYTHVGTDLLREEFDTQAGTWSPPETVIERVTNGATQPVFSCDVQSSLLKVNLDLSIEPTPESEPVFNLKTSVRPRNFPSKATCP